MKKIHTLLCIALLMQSCVPALIITGMAQHGKTKKTRQTFISEFHKTNMEREKEGLQPLDFCAEVKRFDKSWYRSQKECPQEVFKKVGAR